MKKMKNWLLTGLFFMIVSTVFSQGKVTGKITDGTGGLPGANVVIKGSTTATSTDFDGKFTLTSTSSTGEIVISFLGYDNQTVKFNVSNGATTNLGTITLVSNSNELTEIVVKSSTVDIAKDRKTPVAVSTIKASEIQAKLGNQELPELLKSTPSVYVTKSGGGFGDSRITVRGFSQNNVAVMVNGMPVNDMENGSVYWSNWAGLSDVTSAIQIQRGLGSSKLAIASVGGTMNYITKASDLKQGGTVGTSFGNDNFFKSNVAYNTGKLDSGFSASVLYSHTQGDGYVDGTQFNGDNYYVALGYTTKNNKHDFQFTVTGAPQWHDQRSTFITIAQYQKYGSVSDPNIKYNSDWGYKDGQAFNMVRNYYHKPVVSLNYDFQINETSKLSTVGYVSFGRGGGARGAGGAGGNNYTSDVFRTADGLVDYDKIVRWNTGQEVIRYNNVDNVRTTNGATGQFQNSSATGRTGTSAANYKYDTTSGISQISSVNSHNWYGAIVNFNKKFTESLTWDIGVDVRGYKGLHYQNVNNRLGADAYIDNFDVNNPNRTLYATYSTYAPWNVFKDTDKEEKINFNNDGDVRWYGGFTQLEYSTEKFTAFVQGALSQQGFKRVDYFKYKTTDPLSSTDYENILGGNVKGGINYNINEHHNVFVNSGYYSKQPFFNAVYPNNASLVNGNLTNEKIFGLEAGYGLRTSKFSANVNLYRTSWKDRYQRQNDGAADNPGGYYDFAGITEIHSGIEIDGTAKVIDKLTITGMLSIGDWQYQGTSTSNRYDSSNAPIGGGTTTTLFLDGVRVGDAAQTTAALGATYEILPRFTVDANYNYFDRLYAAISPGNFTKEDNRGALQLPSYGTADAGLSYKLLVGKNKSNSVGFRLNVNNVFDYTYIAEAKTNIFAADVPTVSTYKGIATTNQVYFGFGRTWNFALRYDF
ncbi:TonB-dependent receptor [Flavobacterium sp. UBA4854]|uniref:TonB-dependent receptor n=1 Tax=Flavobacterium sp. UBA4854 TaxID=1946548 RepID=UPI00257D239C|nr:TonB-dependent receptor [Flavobacterium sp. UBA4854]